MTKAELLLNSTFAEDLITAICTRPIVYIRTFDFLLVEQALSLLVNQNFHNPLGIGEESIAVVDIQKKKIVSLLEHRSFPGQTPLEIDIMMQRISSKCKQYPPYNKNIFLINNVFHLWNNPVFLHYLHRISERFEKGDYHDLMCILLVDDHPVNSIPSEIEKFVTVVDVPYPKMEDIEQMVKNVEVSKRYQSSEQNIREDLSRTLLGLNYYEIDYVLRAITYQYNCITKNSMSLALSAKKAIVKKSGLIEVCDTDISLKDIGGLAGLVEEIEKKTFVFKHLKMTGSKEYNLPMPKGLLIIGMPGCGKSLLAKAISNSFNTSLLRLDVNKLMGKYVGESEENLRKALLLAETAQPCVLWIDEIEKAFAGANGKDGNDMLVQRLMGQFLTWMQERKTAVYVVATANDVMKPEFMRKGRFDEVFFVDFPSKEETKMIFEKKLNRYKTPDSMFDTSKIKGDFWDVIADKLCAEEIVIDNTIFRSSFSGAEIECLVNAVFEDSFIDYLKKKDEGNTSEEKIVIEKEDFYKKADLMSRSIMAKQISTSKENPTTIEKIRKMQSVYKFREASVKINQ